MELANNDIGAAHGRPTIEPIGAAEAPKAKRTRKKETQAEQTEKTLEEWLRLYKLLFQPNFFPPLADATPARQKQTEKTLRQIVASYPNFAVKEDKIVFFRDAGSISAETKRIQFVANPSVKDNAASSFTMEAAITMARLASQNELMLSKGIKLSGSETEQQMLRDAIDIVNAELPQDMKLVVRSGQEEHPMQRSQQGPVPATQPAPAPAHTHNKVSEPAKDDVIKTDAQRTVEPDVQSKQGQGVKEQTSDAAANSAETDLAAKPPRKNKSSGRRTRKKTPAQDNAETTAPEASEETVSSDVEPRVAEDAPKESVPQKRGVSALISGIISSLSKAKQSLITSKTKDTSIVKKEEIVENSGVMTRRKFFTAGYGGAKPASNNNDPVSRTTAAVADKPVPTQKAVAKEHSNKTRRWLVFGFTTAAASSIATPALGAGFWESLGFKRSETYERTKAASGLYNSDGTKKERRTKSGEKPRGETKAEARARKKQEAIEAEKAKRQKPETRREKAERLKREKEEAAKAKPETRREKAKREKLEKEEAARQKKLEQRQGKGEKPAQGKVRIVCTHTGQSTVLDFNNPRSCKKAFDRVTKDWRQGVVYDMAPALMSLVGSVTTDLRKRGHSVPVIHIVAGFRTEETNNMLIAASKKRNKGKSGVAQNSFHKKGMALDFYIAGISMAKVRNAAKRAGAWSYSAGEFVHMDTRGAYHA